MSKKIFIAFCLYGIGGAQRRAFNLANEFVKKGYEVTILSVLDRDSTITDENYYNADDRIKLVIIPEYYEAHKSDKEVVEADKKSQKKLRFLKKLQMIFIPLKKFVSKINYKINGYRKSKELRAFLISHQGATIISFGFDIFDRTFFAAKGLDFKIIYAETNASNKYIGERYYKFTQKSIKKSDALIFQTQEERAEHGLTHSPKAFVIHNPINQTLPQPYTGEREKIIVNFCRMSRQKNLLLLIQAFEKLHNEFDDYRLNIYADTSVSGNSEYKKELLDYICENNLENHVHILPPSADIHNIINNCAMFVSSSDYEGISNSMIEAMAIGLPCVCTDCGGGGAREMISDGENGILVPVGDAEALKDGMKKMLTQKGLAEKCGKNAATIRSSHSIEKIAKEWLEVINKIQTGD